VKGLGHGQVWWADLDRVRPVVVLTRRTVAPQLRRVLVAPVTSTVRHIPTEVLVGPAEGLVDGSVVSLDNVQLLPVDRLLRRAGDMGRRWDEVCDALAHTIGCHLN